jgi:multidrug efflux pump
VFLVMLMFLQNIRYTIIPTIVVPVALLGTFAVLLALGFSINVLTMFGMVLVIGIVVDDAIVVVENVERIMSEEGLPPHEATRKAMGADPGRHHRHHRGAGGGVRAAGLLWRLGGQYLPAVRGRDGGFHPVLGLHGAVADAGAVRFAAQAGGSRPPPHQARAFGWFNRFFQRTADNYGRRVDSVLPRAFRMLCHLRPDRRGGGLCLPAPAHVIPAGEDQGNILVNVQLPPGATLERTQAVMEQVEGFMLKQPEVQSMVAVLGFSFSGQGQNAALSFITLKDWSERKGPNNRRRPWPAAPSVR